MTTRKARALLLREEQEVVVLVVAGEVVVAGVVEAGAFDFVSDYVGVDAVVGAVAIVVDDAEEGAGLHGGEEVGEQDGRVRDLVVDAEHEGCVDGVGWEFGVVGRAEEWLDVGVIFAGGAVADGVDGVLVDVFGDDFAGWADAVGGADREPASAGAYVGYSFAGRDAQHVHDAVDVELVGSGGVFEDAEVAGVGGAGGVCGWWWRGLLGGCAEGEAAGEQEGAGEDRFGD
jgi:hypothetical protein